MKRLHCSILLLFFTSAFLIGQETGVLTGMIRDSLDQPVELANVALLGTQEGTMTDAAGSFELEIPAGRSFTVVVSCVGYMTYQFAVRIREGESLHRIVNLRTDVRSIREVSVTTRQERARK